MVKFETSQSSDQGIAKLIVTSRDFHTIRKTISALKKAVPEARIRSTGFRAVFSLEVEGDSLEIAKKINQECHQSMGRGVAILAEVQSSYDPIKEAAVKIGAEYICEDERFCFRLYKRGAHELEQGTPRLEYEIGGAIWEVLQQKYGKRPKVDLKDPDVTIIVEVLGPITAVGILKKTWQSPPSEQPPK